MADASFGLLKTMAKERLQKLMARSGLGSRRACEEIIKNGRVTVNGRFATIGDQADPEVDEIKVDGNLLRAPAPTVVVALNKPKYVLSTDKPHPDDPRSTARSLIDLETRLFPIGRLDVDSEGLMLFTNDGELANLLSHPRYEHEKEYRVLVEGQPDAEVLKRWRKGGMYLEEGKTKPARVEIIHSDKRSTWLRIIMKEGRKRQIRRVAAALGHPVRKLTRERIGPVHLGKLKPKEWRKLDSKEMSALRALQRRGTGRRQKRSGKSKKRG